MQRCGRFNAVNTMRDSLQLIGLAALECAASRFVALRTDCSSSWGKYFGYSTVTDLAKFRGRSISHSNARPALYASSCRGSTVINGLSIGLVLGTAMEISPLRQLGRLRYV